MNSSINKIKVGQIRIRDISRNNSERKFVFKIIKKDKFSYHIRVMKNDWFDNYSYQYDINIYEDDYFDDTHIITKKQAFMELI